MGAADEQAKDKYIAAVAMIRERWFDYPAVVRTRFWNTLAKWWGPVKTRKAGRGKEERSEGRGG
jgi:hypothetical protein